jgi:hypothetical protein
VADAAEQVSVQGSIWAAVDRHQCCSVAPDGIPACCMNACWSPVSCWQRAPAALCARVDILALGLHVEEGVLAWTNHLLGYSVIPSRHTINSPCTPYSLCYVSMLICLLWCILHCRLHGLASEADADLAADAVWNNNNDTASNVPLARYLLPKLPKCASALLALAGPVFSWLQGLQPGMPPTIQPPDEPSAQIHPHALLVQPHQPSSAGPLPPVHLVG